MGAEKYILTIVIVIARGKRVTYRRTVWQFVSSVYVYTYVYYMHIRCARKIIPREGVQQSVNVDVDVSLGVHSIKQHISYMSLQRIIYAYGPPRQPAARTQSSVPRRPRRQPKVQVNDRCVPR